MIRSAMLVSFAAAALASAGCADLLGVEDVEAQGGGGGGAGGATPAGGFGAWLPGPWPSGGAETTAATSDATATTGDGAATASTGSGSACGAALPPCLAVVPSTLDSDAALELGFDRDGDADEIDVRGGMLELEPRGDDDDDGELRYAAVKSKVAIAAPASGACAVWVHLAESGAEIAAGIAIGPGTPSEDAYRLERRGAVIAAQVDGVDVAQVPHVKDVTRLLRIWLDAGGQVGFDVSADGACWSAVGGPMARTASEGLVRLHAEGGPGKAKLDDYCL